MPVVFRKVEDSGDKLQVALINKSNRQRVSLAGCTAQIVVVQQMGDGTQQPAVGAEAEVDPAGVLSYSWKPEDLQEPGLYLASFVVAFAASTETFPKKGYIEVRVEPSL